MPASLYMGLSLSFDPDFASPSDWAIFYRSLGIQVVPCKDKSPIVQWKHFQNELVPDETFQKWYGPGGKFTGNGNMGFLCGRCSWNIVCVDLDEHKDARARDWWRAVLGLHNNGLEPDTWQQRTGGGGRQLFFRAPAIWTAPTYRTSIGVDVRGQGGFAVAPPTMHASGHPYKWMPGCAPWEIAIAEAPDWLLREIERLIEEHGGAKPAGTSNVTRLETNGDFNALGVRVDGREDDMTRHVWGRVVGLYRKCPIKPADTAREMLEGYDHWQIGVKPRVAGTTLKTKGELLEMEGRGITAYSQKWARAMAQWETKVRADAAVPSLYEVRSGGATQTLPAKLAQTSSEFVKDFIPPDYFIEGVLQRRFLYSMTAATGTGKTAVALLIVALSDRGLKLGDKEVAKGRTLYFAGENPDDVRMRWLAQCQELGLRPDDMNTLFVPGVFKLSQIEERIKDEMQEFELVCVVVDTSAAYNEAEDENSNTQMSVHAQRMRRLIQLPGGPCVLVLCHPAKNATEDNLTPRGGSSFLAEVDGNLVLSKDDGVVELHWQGKFRGPEFSPFCFQLETVTHPKLKDTKGRLVPTVVARALSDEGKRSMTASNRLAENEVLQSLDMDGARLSERERAERLGWRMRDGTPYQMKVARALNALRKGGFASRTRAGWVLTEKGQNELKRVQNLSVSDGGLKP